MASVRTTSSRLLKLGESLDFKFQFPSGNSLLKKSDLEIWVPLLACPAVLFREFLPCTAGQASSGTLRR